MASDIQFNIKSDVEKLTRTLTADQRKVIPKVINTTINKIATTVRKEAVKTISKETGFKAKDLRDKMFLKRSRPATLTAVIDASGKFSNLIRFKARQTRRGVSAAPWRRRKVFGSAFIGNKGRTVFVRTTKSRLPVRPLFGPAIPREFLRDKMLKIYQEVGAKRFREIFPRELKFRLSRRR